MVIANLIHDDIIVVSHCSQKLPECNALWTTSEALQPLSSVDVSATLYFNNRPVTALLKGVNRLGVLELHQTIKVLHNYAYTN